MREPPVPYNEAARLDCLYKLSILDTEPDKQFDHITKFCQLLFDVPIVIVSLIDAKRQWFKSRQGLAASQTSRKISFCGHAIACCIAENFSDRIFHIPDALQDDRFKDNPLVSGDPKIRFYAGFVLRSEDNFNLGTLCIIDSKPRELSDLHREYLIEMGLIVESIIQSKYVEDRDLQTGIYNRTAFSLVSKYIVSNSIKHNHNISLYCFKLEHSDVSSIEIFMVELKRIFGESEMLARVGQDKFVALVSGANNQAVNALQTKFVNSISNQNRRLDPNRQIKFHFDLLTLMPNQLSTSMNLLSVVDKRFMGNSSASNN